MAVLTFLRLHVKMNGFSRWEVPEEVEQSQHQSTAFQGETAASSSSFYFHVNVVHSFSFREKRVTHAHTLYAIIQLWVVKLRFIIKPSWWAGVRLRNFKSAWNLFLKIDDIYIYECKADFKI